MTNDKHETLSALLDDELGSDEMQQILDAMKSDQALRASWDRYSLIGDALRGEAVRYTAAGISSRVNAALADEPAMIAAPSRDNSSVTTSATEIRWLRPIAGMALAASVAAMAVYVAPLMNQSPVTHDVALASAGTLAPALTLPVGQRWKNLNEPGVASKLDQYLRKHSEFSTPGGMGGVLPYASFVSYDNSRR